MHPEFSLRAPVASYNFRRLERPAQSERRRHTSSPLSANSSGSCPTSSIKPTTRMSKLPSRRSATGRKPWRWSTIIHEAFGRATPLIRAAKPLAPSRPRARFEQRQRRRKWSPWRPGFAARRLTRAPRPPVQSSPRSRRISLKDRLHPFGGKARRIPNGEQSARYGFASLRLGADYDGRRSDPSSGPLWLLMKRQKTRIRAKVMQRLF
jgi:hypothetical protein